MRTKKQQLESALNCYTLVLRDLKRERHDNAQLCCNSSAEIELAVEKEIDSLKLLLKKK